MLYKNFKSLPDLPEEVIDATEKGSLILFLGAGVSRTYGFPSWKKLSKQLFDHCLKRKYVTNLVYDEYLNSNLSDIRLVSTAAKLIDYNSKTPNAGLKKIVKFLKCDYDETKCKKVAFYLSKFNSPIITTNADLSLDKTKYFKDNVYHYLSEEACSILSQGIVHLHGSVKKPSKMIFTAEQYLKYYYFDNNFTNLIRDLLDYRKKYNILFIGYGLSEFEIISNLLPKKHLNKYKMFALEGYKSNQLEKINDDQLYFDDLHIQIIPYSLDNNSYDGLYDVLEKWGKFLDQKTITPYNDVKLLADILNNKPILKHKIPKPLNKIINKRIISENDVGAILFNSKYKNEWIDILQNKEKLFSPNKNLKRPKKEGENSISYVQWHCLTLLASLNNDCKLNKRLLINVFIKSVNLITKDNKRKESEKYASNYFIIYDLFDIALKNKIVAKNTASEIKQLFSICCQNSYIDSYSIQDIIEKHIDVFLSLDKDVIIDVLFMLFNKGGDIEYEKFNNSKYYSAIKKNAVAFFWRCINELDKVEDYIVKSFGSLFDNALQFRYSKYSIYIEWIKHSLQCMNDIELELVYEECLKKNTVVFNKTCVLITTLRYKLLSKKFWNNTSLYKKYLYLDIKSLLSYNHPTTEEVIIMKYIENSIKESHDNVSKKLKVYLLNSLNPKKYPIIYSSDEEKATIENYGKTIYEIKINENDNYYYERIKDCAFNEINKLKNAIMNENHHFNERLWDEGFIKYISDNNYKLFIKYMDEIFKDHIRSILPIRNGFLESNNIDRQIKNKFIIFDLNNVSNYNNDELNYFVNCYLYHKNLVGNNYNSFLIELLKIDIQTFYDDKEDLDYYNIINTNVGSYYLLLLYFSRCCTSARHKIIEKISKNQLINFKPFLAYDYISTLNIFNMSFNSLIKYLYFNNANIIETFSMLIYSVRNEKDIETLINSTYYKECIHLIKFEYMEIHLNLLLNYYILNEKFLDDIINIVQSESGSILKIIFSFIKNNKEEIKKRKLESRIEVLFNKLSTINTNLSSVSSREVGLIVYYALNLYNDFNIENNSFLKIISKELTNVKELFGREDMYLIMKNLYKDNEIYNNLYFCILKKLDRFSFSSYKNNIVDLYKHIKNLTNDKEFKRKIKKFFAIKRIYDL